MNDRRDHYPNYSFEFTRDGNVLSAMFWADEREKAYYNEFGDVISFDATFRTNKYQMIFVPFTAIDHHKKSVTVGAGLLSNETIESYCWLLKAFLKAHGKQPTIVLTDQDPAIKQAVQLVSADLIKNTDFRKRFNKLVWDIRKYTKVLGSVHIQVLVWKMDGSYTMFNTITKILNSKVITRFK
ncbi:hypothetical protein L1887_38685 [Cichorium endivia]|nr:hypothetical protein L1887_38685 [Cichorium endivia]